MCQYLVFARDKSHVVKDHSKSNNRNKQDEIIQMLDFWIDNIFFQLGGLMLQQMIDIPMGTNCVPLLADLPQGILKNKNI